MDETYDITYRVVLPGDRNHVGQTGATPDLAKLGAGDLNRDDKLAMERTEWLQLPDRMKANRSILIDAENRPNEWKLGVNPTAD